jgi:hypothetical protein
MARLPKQVNHRHTVTCQCFKKYKKIIAERCTENGIEYVVITFAKPLRRQSIASLRRRYGAKVLAGNSQSVYFEYPKTN